MIKRPHAPLHRPRWLTAGRIALVATAIGGAITASPAARLMAPHELNGASGPVTRAILVASTTLLSLGLVKLALRSATVQRAVGICILGGALAGAMNAGVVLAGSSLVDRGDVFGALFTFFIGTFVASFFAGPIGLVFGASYALLVAPAVSARLRPSHAAHDRELAYAGAWLALVGLVVLFGNTRGEVEPMSGIAAAALGAVAAAVGLARTIARRRFVRRVERGEAPGFAIVARRMEDAEKPLVPMLDEAPWDGVLVLRDDRRIGPYRGGDHDEPVALVTLPARAAPEMDPRRDQAA